METTQQFGLWRACLAVDQLPLSCCCGGWLLLDVGCLLVSMIVLDDGGGVLLSNVTEN